MRSDPRIWLGISLIFVGACGSWLLLALWLAPSTIFQILGDVSYAITFLAFFGLFAGLPVAWLFRRYAAVRADLLAGRDVIARWRVSEAELRALAPVASTRDRAEKRSALLVIWFFLAVTFGAFALYDREAAPLMLAIGAGVGVVVVIAYWFGSMRDSHLQMRPGEIIVGTRGLLMTDILHVWGIPLTWLMDVELEKGPPAILTITYAFLIRYGAQFVSVRLPVPADQLKAAADVERRLTARR